MEILFDQDGNPFQINDDDSQSSKNDLDNMNLNIQLNKEKVHIYFDESVNEFENHENSKKSSLLINENTDYNWGKEENYIKKYSLRSNNYYNNVEENYNNYNSHNERFFDEGSFYENNEYNENEDYLNNDKTECSNDNDDSHDSYFRKISDKEWEKVNCHYEIINFKDNLGNKNKSLPSAFPDDLKKYWAQRYRLFLRYDEGVQMDDESWYSVTPEMLAAHQAERCTCDVILDAFCGAGGSAIQLAMTCNKVIAIDIDPQKIQIAKHNAKIYGVQDRIDFIVGDYFEVGKLYKGKVDAVFLSPPWGGVQYKSFAVNDNLLLGGQISLKYLVEYSREISPDIALYVPKTTNIMELISLAERGKNSFMDIEMNRYNRNLKALTVYFNGLSKFECNYEI